ncbi:hypothetical protein TNCV_9111 [Trichonephila clavipes]|nr:hypothetical protein TNCV_9111 [Trichonephila clavipes]
MRAKAYSARLSIRVSEGVNINVALFTTLGLLATDLVILNHGQVTRTAPELAPSPNYHTNGGTLDPDVHEQMFLSGVQCDAKIPVLSSQESLDQPTEGING